MSKDIFMKQEKEPQPNAHHAPPKTTRKTIMNNETKIKLIKKSIEDKTGFNVTVKKYEGGYSFSWLHHTELFSNRLLDLLPISDPLEEQPDKGWIPVKERLPEKGTDSQYPFASDFILLSDGEFTYYGQFENSPEFGPVFIDSNGDDFSDDGIEITHWQPLKAPLKQEQV